MMTQEKAAKFFPMWKTEFQAERRAFRATLDGLPQDEIRGKMKAFVMEKQAQRKAAAQARKMEMQARRKADLCAFRESLQGLSVEEKKAKWAERRAQNATNRSGRKMQVAPTPPVDLSAEEIQAVSEAQAQNRAFRASLQGLTKEEKQNKRQARKKEMQAKREAECAAFRESLEGLSPKEKQAKRAERQARVQAIRAVRIANRRAQIKTECVEIPVEKLTLEESAKEPKAAPTPAASKSETMIVQVNMAAFKKSIASLDNKQKQNRIQIRISNLKTKISKFEEENKPRRLRIARMKLNRTRRFAERLLGDSGAEGEGAAAAMPAAKNCGDVDIVQSNMEAFKKSVEGLDDEQKRTLIHTRISGLKTNIAKFMEQNKPGKLRAARMKLNRTLRFADHSLCFDVDAKARAVAIVQANLAAFKNSIANLDDAQKDARIQTRISGLKANITKFEEENKPGKLRVARMKLNRTLRFAFIRALNKNGGNGLKPREKEAAWRAHRALLQIQKEEQGPPLDDDMVVVEPSDYGAEKTVVEDNKGDIVLIKSVTLGSEKPAVADEVVLMEEVQAAWNNPSVKKEKEELFDDDMVILDGSEVAAYEDAVDKDGEDDVVFI